MLYRQLLIQVNDWTEKNCKANEKVKLCRKCNQDILMKSSYKEGKSLYFLHCLIEVHAIS